MNQRIDRWLERSGVARPGSEIAPRQGGLAGRRSAVVLAATSLAAALVLAPGVGSSAGSEHGDEAAAPAKGPVHVATSVCDAQRLKAAKAEDPRIQIEIPAEFNKPWPSLSACESHDATWDERADGPMQPIPFSHKHHAGQFQIDCQYCHSATDRSRAAGMPSVEVCMGCHAQFPKEYDELEGIRILKQHWEEKTPVVWKQIHRLPEHVKFRHNRHVQAGVACQKCHGPVEEIDKMHLVPDTKWWFYGLPTQKLEMGWCIQCHRDNNQQATQDCLACHY
ncbi:MAG: cytochrome c3 family protein [Myxococcota bacterium]|nr:cytochrome c3 family protein [Myxococcales bacterium]